jgi:hypothetical protein
MVALQSHRQIGEQYPRHGWPLCASVHNPRRCRKQLSQAEVRSDHPAFNIGTKLQVDQSAHTRLPAQRLTRLP